MKESQESDEEIETMRPMHQHPTRNELGHLARGAGGEGRPRPRPVTGPSVIDVDRGPRAHLLEGCPRCASTLLRATLDEVPTLRRLIERALLAPDEPEPTALRELADRTAAWATVMEAERAAARELEQTLLTLPPGERTEAVRTGSRYRSLGLVEHLVDRARKEGFRDPAQARCLAELAVETAESLDLSSYPKPFVLEARALSWAVLGNALRVVSDLFGAERAFHSARSHLEHETASAHPVVRAELLSLLGSLRIDQTRYGDAMRCLEEAATIYRAFGEPSQEGKVLVKLAKAWGDAGESERAVALLEHVETVLDPNEDRELLLLARHARAAHLDDAGRSRQAARLFDVLAPEFERTIQDFSRRQRLVWVGARIAWSLGNTERAEEELTEVRRRFAEREEVYDFALVSLDLAVLYLEQGRVGELRRLATEMLPIFTSRRIHQHALAGLVLFQRSAEAETATESFVRDLARFLRRARRNPYLAYEPAT